MWNNIGKKLKGLAMAMCILETIGGVITGIVMMVDGGDEEILIGFLIMALSFFVAWVSSWFLYGFGELVDKVTDIERNTRGGERKSEVQAPSTRLAQSEPVNTETTQKTNDAMDKQCVEAEKKEKMPKRWNIPNLEPISKPDDFQSNPTWINELKSLDSKEIYKRYIDSYNWSDKHRYQCYLELMQRKQEASFEAQEDGFADDFFNITCPYCGEELSFLVGTTEATCPNCYCKIEDM